jgi:hypothetical protein
MKANGFIVASRLADSDQQTRAQTNTTNKGQQ